MLSRDKEATILEDKQIKLCPLSIYKPRSIRKAYILNVLDSEGLSLLSKEVETATKIGGCGEGGQLELEDQWHSHLHLHVSTRTLPRPTNLMSAISNQNTTPRESCKSFC